MKIQLIIMGIITLLLLNVIVFSDQLVVLQTFDDGWGNWDYFSAGPGVDLQNAPGKSPGDMAILVDGTIDDAALQPNGISGIGNNNGIRAMLHVDVPISGIMIDEFSFYLEGVVQPGNCNSYMTKTTPCSQYDTYCWAHVELLAYKSPIKDSGDDSWISSGPRIGVQLCNELIFWQAAGMNSEPTSMDVVTYLDQNTWYQIRAEINLDEWSMDVFLKKESESDYTLVGEYLSFAGLGAAINISGQQRTRIIGVSSGKTNNKVYFNDFSVTTGGISIVKKSSWSSIKALYK